MIVLMVLAMLAACGRRDAQAPDRAGFTSAVDDYLDQRGRLCIGMYDWPIVVGQADRRAGSLGAQQLLVLEALGLVARVDVRAARHADDRSESAPAREYVLTAEGQKFYVREPVVVATATQRVTHPADVCVATLALDRVFGWEPPRSIDGRTVSSVLFSYRIVDAAPWTRTPDVRRAFPMLARAIDNAGSLQLRLGVHRTPGGWIADELTP